MDGEMRGRRWLVEREREREPSIKLKLIAEK
jgi:hypothetical protein